MEKYHLIIISLLLSTWGLSAQENFVEARACNVNYNQLEVVFDRGTGMSTYSLDGKPFSGCAEQDVTENEMYYLHYVKEGKLERQIGYYYSGQKCRDYNFKNGVAHGTLELFYGDGSPYIYEEYKDGKLHGTLKRWRKGQLVREAKFWYGTMMSEQLNEAEQELTEEEMKLGGNC